MSCHFCADFSVSFKRTSNSMSLFSPLFLSACRLRRVLDTRCWINATRHAASAFIGTTSTRTEEALVTHSGTSKRQTAGKRKRTTALATRKITTWSTSVSGWQLQLPILLLRQRIVGKYNPQPYTSTLFPAPLSPLPSAVTRPSLFDGLDSTRNKFNIPRASISRKVAMGHEWILRKAADNDEGDHRRRRPSFLFP